MARLSVHARAQIIAAEKPTDARRMDALTNDLSVEELQTLADLLGASQFVPATEALIPRILPRALAVAQAALQHQAPIDDDPVDALLRRLDLTTLADRPDATATPPPSSPELPVTPPPQRAGPKSAPSTPAGRALKSGPSTPARQTLYHVASSSKEEALVDDWLLAGAASQGVPGGAARAVVKSPRARSAAWVAYVVFFGHTIAVFTSWIAVQKQISGVANAYQCGFSSVAAAEKALAYARAQGWTGDSAAPQPALPTPSSYAPNPLNSPAGGTDRWYVVAKGVHPGIYSSGLECHLNIAGFRNALHKSYASRAEADAAFAAFNRKVAEGKQVALLD